MVKAGGLLAAALVAQVLLPVALDLVFSVLIFGAGVYGGRQTK